MRKLILFFCFLFFTFHSSFSQGVWTWMSGTDSINSGAVYGTIGVPSVNNHPPSLYSPLCWSDLQGNFWLYGGDYATDDIISSDLWKFNPNTLEWTWINGGAPDVIYGTKGIPSPTNTPGQRDLTGCTWVDSSNNLWFYGGSKNSIFADLWKFDIANNEWTWMSGTNQLNVLPVYGQIGVASSTNNPGSRIEIGNAWLDTSGNFWLYAGDGTGKRSYSDLWMFDSHINMWTWKSGSNLPNVKSIYGIKNVFSSTNTPGARWPYSTWIDNSGNFWLFGGANEDSSYNLYTNADLWEYQISIDQWSWKSGANKYETSGIYGSPCQSDTTFFPGSRYENRAIWKDKFGNLWMFGGVDYGKSIFYGDMWVYLLKCNSWSKMSQNDFINSMPTYGQKGVPDFNNSPGARVGAAHWKDLNGNFWLFGGGGRGPKYDDMWRYNPDTTCIVCSCLNRPFNLTVSKDSLCFGTGDTSVLSIGPINESLQWQSSLDGVKFSDLQGDTLSTFITLPTLSTTTYYRILVKNNCEIDSSEVKEIFVNTIPVAGTLKSNKDNICEGTGVTSLLSVTGTSGNIHWQISTGGSHFLTIPDDTSNSYITQDTLSKTTYYRLIAESGSCGTDTSNIVAVHIIPAPSTNFTFTTNGKQISFQPDSVSANVVS